MGFNIYMLDSKIMQKENSLHTHFKAYVVITFVSFLLHFESGLYSLHVFSLRIPCFEVLQQNQIWLWFATPYAFGSSIYSNYK